MNITLTYRGRRESGASSIDHKFEKHLQKKTFSLLHIAVRSKKFTDAASTWEQSKVFSRENTAERHFVCSQCVGFMYRGYCRYFEGISRVFRGYFEGISRVFRGYSEGIPRVFRGHFEGISRVFRGYFEGMPREEVVKWRLQEGKEGYVSPQSDRRNNTGVLLIEDIRFMSEQIMYIYCRRARLAAFQDSILVDTPCTSSISGLCTAGNACTGSISSFGSARTASTHSQYQHTHKYAQYTPSTTYTWTICASFR